MSGTCAIIVCDHGLGHVRRCALMAKEREKTGEQVTLFAPRASVERLQSAVPSTSGLTVHDFSTRTTPERIKQGLPEALKWLEQLPNLDGFDTIVCDNLPEILLRRPDAVISAQFFWHDVLEGTAGDYADLCKELLERYEPRVIGDGLFAMDAVRTQPGFEVVGMYLIPELVAAANAAPDEQFSDLLVTGGTTPAVRERLVFLIQELLKEGPEPYLHVHVDPELLPDKAPSWMSMADFSIEMFCRINTGVCRPGLGILTDLITVGAMIFPVYEGGNLEMRHNAEMIRNIQSKYKRRGIMDTLCLVG